MPRRLMARLLQPLWRVMIRWIPVGDPWDRIGSAPRLGMYGSGARLEFSHFLKGTSTVAVGSMDDIQEWLLGCRYETDEVLFAEADFWQHPSTFERLRAGDCEDFALWAWRKLLDLGYDTDFVAGYSLREGRLGGRHAWLLFRRDGVEYLFEPVARAKERMIRPLAELRDLYVPQFGVDRTGRRFAFAGYYHCERMRLDLT